MSWERGDETFKIYDALVIRQTDKAILVEAPDFFEEPEWIPKKVLHEDSEVWEDSEGGRGVLIVSKWYAKEDGSMTHLWRSYGHQAHRHF